MKRMYYLTDQLDSTEQISKDLYATGISNWNFHVLSKDEAGLYKRHIHTANYFQRLDIIRNAERGAMLGFLAGVVGLIYLNSSQIFDSSPSSLANATMLGVLTLFGAWAGGMAGLGLENQKIRQYHDEIEAGKYLILIDVKAEEEGRVRDLMGSRHPEAQFKRVGSTLINPFKFTPTPA